MNLLHPEEILFKISLDSAPNFNALKSQGYFLERLNLIEFKPFLRNQA